MTLPHVVILASIILVFGRPTFSNADPFGWLPSGFPPTPTRPVFSEPLRQASPEEEQQENLAAQRLLKAMRGGTLGAFVFVAKTYLMRGLSFSRIYGSDDAGRSGGGFEAAAATLTSGAVTVLQRFRCHLAQ